MENPFEIIANTHEEMTGEKFEYTKKLKMKMLGIIVMKQKIINYYLRF